METISSSNVSCNCKCEDCNKYSGPVPIIGLYIAAATMVCSLFLLLDIIPAIRRRKIWLPCKFLSLNSLTLTLLSIAVKLPVDLTTEMPSSLDQFSKLTGTILVCVSIGVLYPSVGFNRPSESVSNLASLTIFVVTVIVNICIQMSTHLITSFIPEHIVTMLFMLVLLLLLWDTTFHLQAQEDSVVNAKNITFENGARRGESMLSRLKTCYLYAYRRNTQFLLCRNTTFMVSCVISSSFLVIMLQAIVRLIIRDGIGVFTTSSSSDYGWSMRMIVGSQILFILLACFATSFRGLSTWDKLDHEPVSSVTLPSCTFQTQPCFSFRDNLRRVSLSIANSVRKFIVYIFFIPCKLFLTLTTKSLRSWCGKIISLRESRSFDGLEECQRFLLSYDKEIDWTVKIAWVDMKRLLEESKRISMSRVRQLILKYRNQIPPTDGWFPTSLEMVLLARCASVSVPHLGASLTDILNQVFDVVYFVESRRLPDKYKRERLAVAKALKKGKDFSVFLTKNSERSQSQTDIERAVQIIEELRPFTESFFELCGPILYISTDQSSVEELCGYMEYKFFLLLYSLLLQLPNAISDEIDKTSPFEDYDEKIRNVLKLVATMESLDDIVPWSFPEDLGITSMTTEAASNSDHQARTWDSLS